MSDVVISVENLSKKYIINHQQKERYTALRDVITNRAKDLAQKPLRFLTQSNLEPKQEEFWALKDVYFKINQGDRVGIIGRNGAGKSTLLKILSRITEPTTGRICIKGRVASLLEVGTGFHPELTGRENIYLNGAILGMSKIEIKEKFDEIVAFAEVEKFLDTPVKRYSSGMYVRLAFAVAAHLEPEILVVDEVLAVGDTQFQKKCLGKLEDVGKEGRTVLFVSHNMAAIKKLCSLAIILKDGEVKALGKTNEAVVKYEESLFTSSAVSDIFPIINYKYSLSLKALDVKVITEENNVHLYIEIKLQCLKKIQKLGIGVLVSTYDGITIAKLGPALTNAVMEEVQGLWLCSLEIQRIEKYLAGGEYRLGIFLAIPKIEILIKVEDIASFQIPELDIYGSGNPMRRHQNGIVPLPIKISHSQSSLYIN